MEKYNHKEIEKKWQKTWESEEIYKTADSDSKKDNFYTLVEFAYPSGNLHVGHWYAFAVPDMFARYKRMNGFNVLFPFGFDSFGLPAENAAIKNDLDPREWTYKNIDTMRSQLKTMGAMFDWNREVITSDPEYYKWTQWLFLQMFNAGMVGKKKSMVNWDPVDQTVLANEQVLADGTAERSGAVVEKRELEEWAFKITDYADRLVDDLDDLDWPESIKQAQREWIGRSEGAEITFELNITPSPQSPDVDSSPQAGEQDALIKVFTTRPDTLFGVTYVVLAPEHDLTKKLLDTIENRTEAEDYINIVKKKSDLQRQQDKEKTGVVLQGITATNPANGETVPVWIADYVLAGYGTGAVMAVPAHDERDFEFAKKFELPIKEVIAKHFILEGQYAEQPGAEVAYRNTVDAIIHDNNGNYYLIDEGPGHVHFVGGGVDEGEDLVTAVKREVEEEVGFTELTVNEKPTNQVACWAFRHTSKRNHRTVGPAFEIILNSETQIESEIEKGYHKLIKVPKEKLLDTITWPHHRWLAEQYLNGTTAMTEYGQLVNSDKFNDLTSEEAKAAITKHVGGEMKTTYKIRDWGISRQRYWGCPIPIVYNNQEKEEIEQSATHINFYEQETWNRLANGSKTVETRALNPEESERYFGDVKNGDVIKAINKKTNEEMFFSVINQWKFKNFKEYFEDKKILEKCYAPRPIPETMEELRNGYAQYSDDYIERIEKNGIIAWEVKRITPGVKVVPDEHLPWTLPTDVDFKPDGTAPLARSAELKKRTEDIFGVGWTPEVDTMDTFVDSSWYFLRYLDSQNDSEFASMNKQSQWMPIDFYSGGAEHTTMHLLYSRFFYKALSDLKLVSGNEPYKKRMNRSMILAEDGRKMSKRWGNTVDPDEQVERVGADSVRTYLAFIGPYNEVNHYKWSYDALVGVRKFLEKVWSFADGRQKHWVDNSNLSSQELEKKLHKTIKKVGDDLEKLKTNTAVSHLMSFLNSFYKSWNESVGESSEETTAYLSQKDFELFLKILAPFAPHMTEEIWRETLGYKSSIHLESWPEYDESLIQDDVVTIGIQINGKVRGEIEIASDESEDSVREKVMAMSDIQKWLDSAKIKKFIYKQGKFISIVI
ncbi:MAG: class I tRNA ligase family protein [Candidatus Nomurabacteria bacterium]|nr:class I tRNA ligase family protein [Candidatus Nomurabacteria bacterium]